MPVNLANIPAVHSPKTTYRQWPSLALPLLCAVAVSGCQEMTKLRQIFHPEQSQSTPEEGARLVLTIEPTEGLEIFLDGTPAGQSTPFRAAGLSPGQHQILIEADGYAPFSLVFELAQNGILELPISLRPNPPGRPSAGAESAVPATARGPRLPATIAPVALGINAIPVGKVTLDGQSVPNSEARLKHAWGSIQTDNTQLTYRFTEQGILEIVLPEDGAQWLRGSEALPGGSAIRVPKAGLTLTHKADAGPPKTIRLSRL